MELSNGTLGVLALIALVVAALAAGAAVLLTLRLRRLHRAYASVVDGDRGQDVFSALERHAGELTQLREDLAIVHGNTEHLREVLRGVVSRVGVVRYDAFEDMGGALSFSAALLDERADGVVISAINGRTETRTYAKPIQGGTSEYNLSPEEVAAIEAAVTGRQTAAPPSRPRRRRAVS